MVAHNGSDLFLSAEFPPACKIDGSLTPLNDRPLTAEETNILVRSIMNDRQIREFDAKNECNFAITPQGIGRFRVNTFVQQGRSGAVLRTIPSEIPTVAQLRLPEILNEIGMTKRGLVLFVGGTGSGKSTSLAAMIGYRNEHSRGHIVTIEDPVEFVHSHKHCLITQREVGTDTESWESALVNALRQAPDVILIGEIRNRETMEHAINFSETGHLCLSTLHANSANQALDRIINLFPEERRPQLLMDLSLNLKAVVSQRLLPKVGGGRVAAVEIMINTPLIADHIFKGKVGEMKAIIKRSAEQGMQTFDSALFDLYEEGLISYEDALRSADSMNELRLRIKLESRGSRGGGKLSSGGLKIANDEDDDEPIVFGGGADTEGRERPAPSGEQSGGGESGSR
ncbi:MAG: PilT/PilU family type 4a pilus ATPase [Thiohalocapsa sp.]|nr:PilT/PilU family type 4a pilus ATPase [Thiohalocapsa sp.]MCF7989774.1 PilT/PilU family type 4a pilus ATPase [Thiohalocapsa sp.]